MDRSRGGVKFTARARLAAASAFLAVGLFLVPSVAMANPAIVLSPDKGPVGTSVTVSGNGFAAHSLGTVNWGDSILTDFATNASGAFSIGIVVPQVKSGAHDVVVMSTAGTASARFVVQGPEPTTTTEPTTTSTTSTTTTSTTNPTTTTAPSPTTTAPTTTAPSTTTPTSPTTTSPTTTSPTTTSPTTTTTPSSTPTTSFPTTTTPNPSTTSPTSTPSPTQTTWEQASPTPTDSDPEDPTTSTTRSATDEPSPSTADPSADTTPEDSGTASDPGEESTTSTMVTQVTSEMTLPFTSLRAWGTEDDPPELAGERMEVGEFSLVPAEGVPGATLELSFRFDRAIPGLTSVQVMMDDTALGDQIPVDDSRFSVGRTVPDLPPDTYEVTVLSGDLLLATAEFTVLEPAESAAGSAPVVVLGVLAMVAGLGWRATRNFQGNRASSGSLGPVDTWYAWRERRRR